MQAYWHEARFERGDTFAALLNRLGVDGADTMALLKQQGGSKPFRNLRPGMTVHARTSDLGQLLELRFVAGEATVLGFARDGERFGVVDETAELVRRVYVKEGRDPLVALRRRGRGRGSRTASRCRSPTCSPATSISIATCGAATASRSSTRSLHHQGRPLRSGRVLAAEFVNNRKTLRAVWFVDEDGKRRLLRAGRREPAQGVPALAARVLARDLGFRDAHAPDPQEWRAHKGVDYGAPAGTRVRATADGVVQLAGSQGGYGNLVVLRHHGGITTALRPPQRLRQAASTRARASRRATWSATSARPAGRPGRISTTNSA